MILAPPGPCLRAVLYIVATPIGNLEDVSLRALEVLRTVDVIASEDTRHTAKLLTRHQIKARQMPFHEHNEARVVGKIVRLLQEGRWPSSAWPAPSGSLCRPSSARGAAR